MLKGHLLLGLVFLLKHNLKGVRGDDVSQCAATECKLGEIYPVPDEDDTYVKPEEDCYQSGDVVNYKCYGNLDGQTQNTCQQGAWEHQDGPTCIADCHLPTLDNGITIPSVPPIKDGKQIVFVCNRDYTLVGVSISICGDGEFDPPEIPLCYEKCSPPVIPNSDSTSPTSLIEHGQPITVTCNSGYSNGKQKQSSTSVCNNGTLQPTITFCYAQCNKPMIPNSNSTSPNPLIDHGGVIVVRCDDGYYNGESETATSVCNDGILDPVVPFCYAQCERPDIPDSNSTSPTPGLKHGDSITVTCDSGYSSDLGKSMTAVCIDGTLNPTVPYCFAKCRRPIIPNSNSSSSTPLLDHGDALTVTCDTGYSDGKSRATTSTCDDGTFDPPVSLCYHQCNRPVIPDSNATSAYPVLNHDEELTVTCNNGFSNGQSVKITTMCDEGTLIPAVPPCYADCKSLKTPEHGVILSGSNPYYHREVVVFNCDGNYTLVGEKEIYCYDGLWYRDPPVCKAHCSRPVVRNSDAISPTPPVPHGTLITVACNNGYSYSDAARTTLLCLNGTIIPGEPRCIVLKWEPQDIAALTMSVLALLASIGSLILSVMVFREEYCE